MAARHNEIRQSRSKQKQVHGHSCLQLDVAASPEAGYPSQEGMAVVKRRCQHKFNFITG